MRHFPKSHHQAQTQIQELLVEVHTQVHLCKKPSTCTFSVKCTWEQVRAKRVQANLIINNLILLQSLLFFLNFILDNLCNRLWSFERFPNKILRGLDNAIIFTANKEACLSACLNEVFLSLFSLPLLTLSQLGQLGALRLPLGGIQLPDDAVSPERVRPPLSGRLSPGLGRRYGNWLLWKFLSQM